MIINDKPEVKQKDFAGLEKKLDLKFKNIDLLIQAFVHRSFLNELHDFPLGNNERLEFLGDAVVELAVTEYLFNEFGNPEPSSDLYCDVHICGCHRRANLSVIIADKTSICVWY